MKILGIIVLFFLLSLFKLAGCQPDTIDIPVPEDDRLITVNFSAISTSGESLLKSAATPDEDLINKVILFGVDEPGNIIKVFPEVGISGQNITISKNIKSLYAIANPPATIDVQNLLTVSNLMAMTSDFSNAPKSPFLMSGKADVVANSASVSIELVRAVARIDVVGKNGFQIEKITVSNIPNKGYVFKNVSLTAPGIIKVTHTYNIISASSNYSVYVPENSSSDPIKLDVTGKLQGKTVSCTVDYLKKGGQRINIERNTCYEVGVVPADSYKDGIKILAIGNSYSQNAMLYMYALLNQLGIPESKIVLVNAMISSATLKMHAENAISGNSVYNRLTYSLNGFYTGSSPTLYSLYDLIRQQEWDVITLQQESAASGQIGTYNQDLVDLINFVKTNARNPNFKLGWHMTWAYQNGSSFMNAQTVYNKDQLTMYKAICSAVQEKIVTNPAFDFIIPSGTAIQNARRNAPIGFGDNLLNRDGSHLSNLGCYLASVMWVKTITGYDISKLTVNYNAAHNWDGHIPITIDKDKLDIILQAVYAAAASPFESP